MNSVRRNIIISKICLYDEWFTTLVKTNSYQVKEKIDYLLQRVNLEIFDEHNFQTLLKQVDQFYKERLDPESYWESITDFNYQVRTNFNYRAG